jgi:hypothetical protein
LKANKAGIAGFDSALKAKHWGAEAGFTQRPMDLLIDTKTGGIVDLKYAINP